MKYPLITKTSTFDAIILCDGDYPVHEVPLSILQHASYLCCCDGALTHSIASGLTPQAVVGDGDSLPAIYKEKYADIIHIVNEQENNDQTKSTLYCQKQGFKQIAYIGSTGKREDHTIGNVVLLAHYYADFGLQVTMITDYGYFVAASGKQRFQTFAGQQMSIFNIGGCTRFLGKGLKSAPYAYAALWQGTLNEAVADEVELDADGVYIVYRTFGVKGKGA